MGAKLKLVGQKFNKLLVISESEKRDKHKKVKFNCVCDCGNIVIVIGSDLKSGNTKSCSCEQKRIISDYKRDNPTKKTHGLSKHYLYRSYISIIHRCYSVKSKAYKNYGGRGIKVCDKWMDNKNGLLNFMEDIGERPSEKHSIDRIDNNKGYSPENCRWATFKEQSNNKRNNRILIYNNEKYTASELSEFLNINYQTLLSKLNKNKNNESKD